jgi:hypothetical protein
MSFRRDQDESGPLGGGPGQPAEVGRDERNRYPGDKNDRDNGQDSAHGKVSFTPLGRIVARTIRRPSQVKMTRNMAKYRLSMTKYDIDNKSRACLNITRQQRRSDVTLVGSHRAFRGNNDENCFITGVIAGLSCLFAYGPADAFGVSYKFVGVNDPGIYGDGVVTLTTTGTAGEWLPTAITGSVTDDQLSPEAFAFTGVVPVGDYASNTNILFVPESTSGDITTLGFTDYFGAAYTTDLGVDLSFAAQSATGPYVLVLNNSSQNPPGERFVAGSDEIMVTSFSVVPELSTWAMLCVGFVGVGLVSAMRGRKTAAAQ